MLFVWFVLLMPACAHAQISLFSSTGSPNIISNSNIPYTISAPGRYIVVENITYNATGATPAITVNSSQVTLDLLQFTVAQTSGVLSVTGIQINSGLQKVTVRNGCIDNFSQSAVSVASGCTQIGLENLLVRGCGSRGIEFVGTTASLIGECTIKNCSVITSCTVATADNVLTLSNVVTSQVSDCQFNANGSSVITGTFTVVHITGCRRLALENVHTHYNNGNFDTRGFNLKSTAFSTFSNCKVNTMTAVGGGSACRGFVLEGNTTSTANIFSNCMVTNLTGTRVVDGFLSGTGCDNNYFEACLVSHNDATLLTSGVSHGFYIVANSNNKLRNCIARANRASGSVATAPLYGSYGFRLDNSTRTMVNNCIAESNTASGNNRAVGFFVMQANLCVISKCCAHYNTTFGFDASNGTFNNNMFTSNYAFKNNTTSGAAQYNGFGANAANDSLTPSNFAMNSGGVSGQPGPIAWSNLGVS